MLSAFILGLSLGAFWVRRRADEGAASLRLLALVQLAMGSFAIATLPVYMQTFQWMVDLIAAFAKTSQGYALFTVSRYGICLAVMLPATFCAGMTLPLITRLLVGAGTGERAIGQVYGVNTLGSIVGAGLAGLVLLPLLGLKWLLVFGASIDLALGVALIIADGRRGLLDRAHRWQLAGAGVVAAALVTIAVGQQLDRNYLTSGVYRYGGLQRSGPSSVLFYTDGRTATVSVRRISSSGGLTLGTNGKPDASLGPEWLDPNQPVKPGPFTHDAPTQLFVPLVALAHAPAAKEAAVIGFGSGMTTHALLGSSQLQHVVTIEIEPEMIRAARAFFPANARAYQDPRSTFAIDDARAYFAARSQKFDLIISEPSNPWVSGVSGLFTTEFYSRIKSYLTPNGVFAQWLHLYEIDDGLVLSVIAAVQQHFPNYSIFQVSSRDILIVASANGPLREPDWSIFQMPGLAGDLRHVWPITPHTMETLRIADSRALEPLVRSSGVVNSDFYPMLDLNAERTRYMKSQANGLGGLASNRINFAAMVEGRRSGLGDPYAVVTGVPRLDAMAIAAGVRTHDPRAGAQASIIASRRQIVEAEIAAGQPPVDWHAWVGTIESVEDGLHGGMAGVADTAFYASLRRYVARTNAPELARAAVDFMHGLAAWDYAEAERATDPLVYAASKGDLWLDADVLRDGAVMAKLATGHRSEAREIFKLLIPRSGRDVTDLRTRLLYAYVADTTDAPLVAVRR
jgi:spermidine synthase